MLDWVLFAALAANPSIVDCVAPLYTIGVGCLIVIKYVSEKQLAEAPSPEDSKTLSPAGRVAKARHSQPQTLGPLVEPETGEALPAFIRLPGLGDGSPLELVSLGCGARVRTIMGMAIKVYALGVYVEFSDSAREALASHRASASSNTDREALLETLLSESPGPKGSFAFSRALHLVLQRSVTGKQVSDALGERLKGNVSAAAYADFSNALLNGIGPKGLNAKEAIEFLWCGPGLVRVVVRGAACGDLKDAKLPSAIFQGIALGPSPGVPEAKASVLKGFERLFFQTGGGGGGGAAQAEAVEPPVTEPATGLELPASLVLRSEQTPGGGGGGAWSMRLLGLGVRVKSLGFVSVNVYALGIMAETHTPKAKEKLRAALATADQNGGNQALCAALLSQESGDFFPKGLHMVFARGVSGKQISDALGEKLKLNVTAAAFQSFSTALLDGIGPSGLSKGEALFFLWSEPEELRVFIRGVFSGVISDPKLPRVLHAGFLGADPAVPEAKAGLAQGARKLLAI